MRLAPLGDRWNPEWMVRSEKRRRWERESERKLEGGGVRSEDDPQTVVTAGEKLGTKKGLEGGGSYGSHHHSGG